MPAASSGSVDWQQEWPQQWQQDSEYVQTAKEETEVAHMFNIPWQLRGPPAPTADQKWFKGQRYRQNAERWGNRGGSRREWYSAYYGALQSGASKDQAKAHADDMHPDQVAS